MSGTAELRHLGYNRFAAFTQRNSVVAKRQCEHDQRQNLRGIRLYRKKKIFKEAERKIPVKAKIVMQYAREIQIYFQTIFFYSTILFLLNKT